MMEPLKELFEPSEQEFVTTQQIREGLTKLCRAQLEDFQTKKDEIDDYNEEVLDKTGGKFARDYIERISLAYQERQLQIEAEPDNKKHRIEQPFQEMEQVLGDFFTNDELNNELVMVTGEDLIKMLDICLFLGG